MTTFNELSYALLQEVLKKSPSSRAVRKLSQEAGEKLKELRAVGNASINSLVEGSKFPPRIGMNYYISSASRTLQKDGPGEAAFSIGAAIQSIDQILIDTGNGSSERAIVGAPLLTMVDAVYAIEVVDQMEKAKRVLVLHKILNVMSEMYYAASTKLRDVQSNSVKELLGVINAVMSSEEFNVSGAWLNMMRYVYRDEPVTNDLQQYFKTFLTIFNTIHELEECPVSFREYLDSLHTQGITFRKGSFTMGTINVDTSPIEEVK